MFDIRDATPHHIYRAGVLVYAGLVLNITILFLYYS